jgi:hypothetical protein
MVIDLGEIDQEDLDHAQEAFLDFLDTFDGNDAALFYHMPAFIAETCMEIAEKPH